MSLELLLRPRSVAIVGASDDVDSVGGRPLHYLGRSGFAGAVHPVNHRRALVQGRRAYADVASLPATPDVALIAVGGAAVVEAVRACAARGVAVAVVLASGFGETGVEGRRVEDEMVAVARAAGMRLVGPNCYGAATFASGAVLTFSTALRERFPAPGPVSVVSQSGSMSVAPMALLGERGIGVRGVYGTGNDADVSVLELAAVVAAEPDVEVLLVYVESIRDAAALADLGTAVRDRGLPTVLLKAGRTPAGHAAAVSHTGAVANEDRVVSAVLEAHGIGRARDLDELVAGAPLLAGGRRWRRSSGVVVVSNSGASCVQAADAVEDHGLVLAELDGGQVEALRRALPTFATARNPVDLTAGLLGDSSLLSKALDVVAASAGAPPVVLALPVAGPGYDVEGFAAAASSFVEGTGSALVVASPLADVRAAFAARDLPTAATEAQAVAALAGALAVWDCLESARRHPPPAAPPVGRNRSGERNVVLAEDEGLRLVAAAGVPVVESRSCSDVEEAVAAFEAIGGPVAVKGCSARLAHKSELGLVAVGLDSVGEVRAAAAGALGRLRELGLADGRVLVQAMASGVEVLVGGRWDDVLGPVVVVGAGGVDAEALDDVAVLAPPFDRSRIARAVAALRLAPLLRAGRGRPAADLDALVDTAAAVGALLLDERAGVRALDLNPVLVAPAGAGCRAADALVALAAPLVRSPVPQPP